MGGIFRDEALKHVALMAVEAGELKVARSACDSLFPSNTKDDCVAALSSALAARGEPDKALEVAKGAANDWGQARAILLIAVAQVRKGHTAEAVRLAESVRLQQSPFMDSPHLRGPPRFSWRNPETWVRNYRPDAQASSLIAALVDEQYKADLAAAAMALEQLVGAPKGRDYAAEFWGETPPILRSLARAQSLEGHPEEALRWARKTRVGDARVWAVLGVADAVTFAPVPSDVLKAEGPVSGIIEFMRERPQASSSPPP